ncbi:MAG: AI-2E family transporter [Phycisphaerales bacterium]|nr:MAG: AI-2E family transporter [Phycisphaerales bacterium]
MTDEAGPNQNEPGNPEQPGKTPPEGSPASDRPEAKNPWLDLHLWQIQPVRDVLMVAGVIALFWLGAKLSVVTVPLLLAILFAYLFEPVVRQMVRISWMTRRLAALVLIFFFGFVIVLPASVGLALGAAQGVAYAAGVASNIDSVFKSSADPENTELYDDLPGDFWRSVHDMLVEWRRTGEGDEILRDIGESLRGEEGESPDEERDEERERERDQATADDEGPTFRQAVTGEREHGALIELALNWTRANAEAIAGRAVRTGAGAVEAAFSGLISIVSFAFMLFLTAFFFLFISPGFKGVIDFGRSLVPEKNRDRVEDLVVQMDRVVSGFVRGRLTIAVILSVYLTLGYAAVGVPAPLLLGPLVGVLSVIPYLGMIGLPITVVAMLLEPGPLFFEFQSTWWWAVIGPYVIWQIAQVGDDYFLTPVIQGKSVNMDTPTILFAVLAGGALAGFYGVLVAIPVAACLKILVREVFWPRFERWAKGEEKDFLPIGRE